ncbi:DUF1579 family protein [Spongiactinospora sp. TRM90649]|uniref:DUF1579 family protein n=1 Tax=Spongiactinospora sp. TRM90649 TaxID=3031114 RepID=UPI0023F8EFD3|nr:DUF1579 family protein [Spongiactinospora sp. TRM90649]MDF5757296.1 DUF1579 family protein [Spongiactinospora sp. TRM90649]
MHDENRRLAALIGRWRSEGRTVATPEAPSVNIGGHDVYEWFPGEQFLVHHVDVLMGGEEVRAIEMIGPYDPATASYPMRAFDHQGAFTTMDATRAGDTWTFTGPTTRATLTITPDTMRARWDRLTSTSTWTHWMDMTFTKEP